MNIICLIVVLNNIPISYIWIWVTLHFNWIEWNWLILFHCIVFDILFRSIFQCSCVYESCINGTCIFLIIRLLHWKIGPEWNECPAYTSIESSFIFCVITQCHLFTSCFSQLCEKIFKNPYSYNWTNHPKSNLTYKTDYYMSYRWDNSYSVCDIIVSKLS